MVTMYGKLQWLPWLSYGKLQWLPWLPYMVSYHGYHGYQMVSLRYSSYHIYIYGKLHWLPWLQWLLYG